MPVVAEAELARAVSARKWAQFQLSTLVPEIAGLLLMLIGDVTRVEIQDGGFKCRSDDPLRVRGEGWERARQPPDPRHWATAREKADHDVSVRFPANRVIVMKQSPLGRLVLVAAHPRESVILVLFPQGDCGDIEMFDGLTIEPVDLARAREMVAV